MVEGVQQGPVLVGTFFGTPKWLPIGRIDVLCGPKAEKWPYQRAEKTATRHL